MSVKITSSLPDGDGNGLDLIASELASEPWRRHVVVAIVDTKKLTTDTDTGAVVPTARVRRIEVIADVEDKGVVRRMLERAFERRTGKVTLPLDLERDIAAAFEGVDLSTGEMPGDAEDASDGEA